MKLRTFAWLSAPLLVTAVALASPASASQTPADSSRQWGSVVVMEVGTGKVLQRLEAPETTSVIMMEVHTGKVLDQVDCTNWPEATGSEFCAGKVVESAPAMIAAPESLSPSFTSTPNRLLGWN